MAKVTMRHPQSGVVQEASKDAFDRLWSQEGWRLVGGPPAPSPERSPTSPPPRGGPGSGADVWAAYAHAHGVHVRAGANREQIQALLAEAGIPVE